MDNNHLGRTALFEWAVAAGGLALSVAYLPGLFHFPVLLTLGLFALAIMLEFIQVPLGKVVSSLIIALPIAAVAVYGPSEALWLMLVAEICVPLLHKTRSKLSITMFNMGQYAISTYAMYLTYHVIHPEQSFAAGDMRTIAGALAGTVAFLVVNHGFIHVHNVVRGTFAVGDILPVLAQEGLYVLIALPFSFLMIGLGSAHPWLAPLVLVPTGLLGQSLRIYQRTSYLQKIDAATSQLTSEFDIERISEHASRTVADLTYAEMVVVFVLDESRNTIIPNCVYPVSRAHEFDLAGYREEQGGVIWDVIRQNDWVYVPDTRKDPRVRFNGAGCRQYLSMAIFPMQSRGTSLGAIVCYAGRPYAFGELTEHVATLASQVAVLLDNAKLYQQLQEQSWRDGATGLFNYRYFYETLSRRVQHASDNGRSVSVAIVDVDYFKKVNDTYGHLAGDEVLRSFGALLTEMIGADGVVARYGGEEFGVILAADARETLTIMERIRAAVMQHAIRFNGYCLQGITVSCGIASYPRHADNDRDLLLKADSAMYWGAKQRGRNRSALYAPEFDAQLFIDALTGLHTYHFLNLQIRQEFLRGTQRWGVACIDLDHFAHVNSAFGFDVGDQVLKETSMVIRECLRQSELACRFGGDEFLISLPNVGQAEIDAVGQRIVKAISTHRFECGEQIVISLRARCSIHAFTDLEDAADLIDRVGGLFAHLHQVNGESLA